MEVFSPAGGTETSTTLSNNRILDGEPLYFVRIETCNDSSDHMISSLQVLSASLQLLDGLN